MNCKDLKVLVIGASGAGKTSLINLFYTWSKNWDLKDIFAAKKVQIKTKYLDGDSEAERDTANQGESQTQIAKVYKFYLEVPEEKTSYLLNFLDTPGVGDTRGMKYDEQNIDLIVETVAKTEDLNAIILVLNGSEARSHSRIQYMLKKLQSIIPRDFAKNLIVLLSNVDLEPNLDLKTLFGSQLEEKLVFWYNNQIFNLPPEYFNNRNILARSQQTYRDSVETISSMLNKISSLPLITTQGFAEMQDNRDRFKRDMVVFGEIIYEGLIKKDELQKICLDIKKGEIELSQLEDKLITISCDGVWKTIPTKNRNTICCLCKRTCHPNCNFDNQAQGDQRVKDCLAFNIGKRENCIYCSHSYTSHVRLNEIYQRDENQAIRDQSEIQYLISTLEKKKSSEGAYIKALTSEIERFDQESRLARKKLVSLVRDLRKICSRFDHIQQIDNCIKIFGEKAEDIQKKGNDLKCVTKVKALMFVQKILEGLKKYILEELQSDQKIEEISEPRVSRPLSRVENEGRKRAFSSGNKGLQNSNQTSILDLKIQTQRKKSALAPIDDNLLTENRQIVTVKPSYHLPEKGSPKLKSGEQQKFMGSRADHQSFQESQQYHSLNNLLVIKKIRQSLESTLQEIACLNIKNSKEKEEMEKVLNNFNRESKRQLENYKNGHSENQPVVLNGAAFQQSKKNKPEDGLFAKTKNLLGCKKALR